MCLTPKDVVKLNTTSNAAIRAEGNCEWSGSAADRVIFATVRKSFFPPKLLRTGFRFTVFSLRQPWGNEWATPGVTRGYYRQKSRFSTVQGRLWGELKPHRSKGGRMRCALHISPL